jgi:hypothetical protein
MPTPKPLPPLNFDLELKLSTPNPPTFLHSPTHFQANAQNILKNITTFFKTDASLPRISPLLGTNATAVNASKTL